MPIAVNQNLRKKVDAMGERLLHALLPPTCLLCDQGGAFGLDLCEACWRDLPANRLCCTICALPLAAPAPACARCLARPPRYARTVAPLLYLGGIASLVPGFKFHHQLASGRLLAELFCRQTRAADLPEALVPVPLHASRLRSRGFDQALELAKRVARQKAIPLRSDLLSRQRNTLAQSDLDALQRRRNCRGAFVVSQRPMPSHIAVFDDVMTTGATVQECARVLLKAGARRVDIWVIARVP